MFGCEFVHEEVIRAAAVGSIRELAAVGRPRELRFLAGRIRQANRVTAVFGRRRKNFAVNDKRDLLSVGR